MQASIAGRTVEHVIVVPRQALQDTGQVLVVDRDDRLRFRSIEVLRVEGNDVFVERGLIDGERVCISAIQAPVDGMKVRPFSPEAAASGAAEGA